MEKEKKENKESQHLSDVKKERSDQAKEIFHMLGDKNKIKSLYDSNSPKKGLAEELFVKGIDPKNLIRPRTQARFQDALSQAGSLIFYPTLTTSEIFKTISKNLGTGFCLSSCKGIGKSFALALFVYLFRQKENTRVFYMHNSAAFVRDPKTCFVEELDMAFSQELKDLNYPKEKFYTMLKEEPNLDFLGDLFRKLDELRIEVYIIFDQVNELQKIHPKQKSPSELEKLAWNIFERLKIPPIGNSTIIMMSSVTNEMITQKVEQEFRCINLELKDPLQEAAKKFLEDRLDSILKKEIDGIKKVQDLTCGHFSLMHEFAKYYEPDLSLQKNIAIFEDDMKIALKQDIDKFLAAADLTENERAEIKDERKKRMTIVLHSITNDLEIDESIFAKHYDVRHFVHIQSSNKMKPVYPLIMTAYMQMFSEVYLLAPIIKLFKNNSCLLRFILKTIVLITYPKSKLNQMLDLVSMVTFQKAEQINLTNYTKHYTFDQENFDFDRPGLYLPKMYNFTLFDALIKEQDIIYVLQVTKSFGSSKLNDSVCDSWKESKSILQNTKFNFRNKLHEMLQKTGKTFKILLISLEQNPLIDDAFTTVFNNMEKEKAQNFFYIDAIPILQKLGFDTDLIKIMQYAEVME